jgi:hypothetical protein
MKLALLGAGIVALFVGPIACSDSVFDPDQSVILGVSKLDAPATVSAGSPLTVVLTVTTGGCTAFDHVEIERDASGASFTAWGIDGAKGRTDIACPQYIENTPHSYQLDPPFQSVFTITVNRGRISPLIATVQIQ